MKETNRRSPGMKIQSASVNKIKLTAFYILALLPNLIGVDFAEVGRKNEELGMRRVILIASSCSTTQHKRNSIKH
jgi:hypothetical protein